MQSYVSNSTPKNHYKSKGTCTIEGIERKNRKKLLEQYWQGEIFKKHVLPLITSAMTNEETLNQKLLQCGSTMWVATAEPSKDEHISSVGHANHSKYDEQIMTDLGLECTDVNQIAERILQLTKNQMTKQKGFLSTNNVTIAGYVPVDIDDDKYIFPVLIGFMGRKFGSRWGIDCQLNVPWTNGLRILQEAKK